MKSSARCGVGALIFASNGKQLIARARKGLVAWSLPEGKEFYSDWLPFEGFDLFTLAVSPDGRYLASGGWNAAKEGQPGELAVWDLRAKKRVISRNWHEDVIWLIAFSKDGKALVTGSGNAVRSWSFPAPIEPLDTRVFPGDLVTFKYNAEANRLASAGEKVGQVKLWDFRTKKLIRTIQKDGFWVRLLGFSPDGKFLAAECTTEYSTFDATSRTVTLHSSGNSDKLVVIWDLEIGRQIASFRKHTEGVFDFAFHPHEHLIATVGGSVRVSNILYLWDYRTGKVAAKLDFRDRQRGADQCISVALSPDGKVLATGFQNGTVQLYDIVKQ